jgi:L-fucose mutarotase/ribose pyranase (RbsD/FucU family)
MLRGISPLLSPDLLAVLCRMGHGDEIVLADAHFPGETFNSRVLRADGLRIPPLIEAILPLFVLDNYAPDPATDWTRRCWYPTVVRSNAMPQQHHRPSSSTASNSMTAPAVRLPL